jgi:hypothetical protein
MNVDVINGLTTVASRVDDSAVSLSQPLGARDLCSGPLKVAQQFFLFFLRMSDGRDMFSRNDEDVHWGLRLQVSEGVAMIILVDGFRGNASIDDLAEDATHDEEFTGAFSNRRGIRGSDVSLQRVCG